MPLRYLCILPNDWQVYSNDVIEIVLYNDIKTQWNNYRTLHGTFITIENVTAEMIDHQRQFWFRRINDINNDPDGTYFKMRIEIALQ